MPAGPAPTTATRSRGGGNGGPGSSSADTSRILSRRGGQAPGSENPESRRPPVSVVVATITPQSEHAEAVREAVLAAVPQVHAEEGCERYALHEARDGSLVMIEQWASPEALAAHGKGEPFTELSRQLEGKLAGAPELQVLSPVPAGDDAKGVL